MLFARAIIYKITDLNIDIKRMICSFFTRKIVFLIRELKKIQVFNNLKLEPDQANYMSFLRNTLSVFLKVSILKN